MEESGRYYDQTKLGDSFSRTTTVTETHLVLGAGLIGDFNPLHVNEEFAKKTRYGSRILHGMMTSAIMGGNTGMYFFGTAIAYLEHNVRFKAPVRVGDTLTCKWTITERVDKPQHGAGIVAMKGTCTNQLGVLVADADAKLLVAATPA